MSEPVPGSGKRTRGLRGAFRGGRGGVSVNSKVLPHRYAAEGDRGQWFRRQIRRAEKRIWKKEIE